VRIVAQLTAAIAPWHRGYDRSWLSKDIVAELAAGAVVIPQAMAY
jgi:sulfate permease, SulP family